MPAYSYKQCALYKLLAAAALLLSMTFLALTHLHTLLSNTTLTCVCRYKLEAIEATYLCCAGAPNREEDGGVHADRCVEMALTMMAIADHAV
jgi:hypothetical protein